MTDTTASPTELVEELAEASSSILRDRGWTGTHEQLGASGADNDLVEALLLRSDAARAAWVQAHPELAAQLAAWTRRTRRAPLPSALRAHADVVWRNQREALLVARKAVAGDEPSWRHAARVLLAGRVAAGDLIDDCERWPIGTREDQERMLAEYHAENERATAIDAMLADRPAWRRSAAERVAIAAHYDRTQLVTCSACDYHAHVELMSNGRCWYCGGPTRPFDPTPVEPTEALYKALERADRRPGRRPLTLASVRRTQQANSRLRCFCASPRTPIHPDNHPKPVIR